jgi:hypothetical protein
VGPAGFDDQGGEQAADLVAGQRDEPDGRGPVGVLMGGDHCEQGVREHREQRPAPPGGLPADLVLVEPGQALAGSAGATPGGAPENRGGEGVLRDRADRRAFITGAAPRPAIMPDGHR